MGFPQPLTRMDPAGQTLAVTPNDTSELTAGCRGLYIGVSGDVTIDDLGGNTAVLFKAHPVGYMPVMVKRVRATGTTATNIVALY